jgi:cytochrome c-type biogenesis protein CcmH
MRNRVRELVEQGYSEPQILDYFASKYGEWILLQPRPTGLNWILWLTPAFAAVFGVTWLVLVMQRWRTEPEAPELAPGAHPSDPYEAKLLKELDE